MHTPHAAPSTPTVDVVPIRRVLVSVFDKSGLDRLAAALGAAGVRVASTGGTATALTRLGLEVDDVSAITRFPEVLDGRVKTLHPNIFAGILARGDERCRTLHRTLLLMAERLQSAARDPMRTTP